MKRSQKDNLNEISRASKSRRWDGEEQENLTSLFLPVRNGMVIAENEEAISSLQSRLDTCEIQNQLHQDQLKTHERQLALIRLAQRKETEKIDAQKATVEMLSAHAESAEQKLNTLANSHQAFESKLEANMKQTLSIAQENLEKGLDDLQGNTRQGLEMLAEYTELLELWVQRKEAITKLMAFLGSPEKLEYLKRLMLKEDESHLITSDPYNTPPGSQAGAGSSLLSQEIAEIASPHAERSAQSPPRYFRRWLDVWNFFREKYERDLPSNDARFIRTYLTQHRQETASFLQNTILEHCNTAQPRQNEPHGRHGIKLFVHLRTFAWQDVLDAFEHINYPELHRVLQIDEHRRQRRVVGPAMVPLEGITCSRNNQWAGTGDAEI